MPEKVYKSFEKPPKQIFTGGTLTPPRYMPTFYEWLSIKGKLKSGFASVENNTVLMYTVPENKILFLTAVSLTVANVAILPSLATCDFMINNVPAVTVKSGTSATGSGNTSVSFSPPLKLVSQQRLEIYANRANCWLRCCYIGYEIAEKDLLIP